MSVTDSNIRKQPKKQMELSYISQKRTSEGFDFQAATRVLSDNKEQNRMNGCFNKLILDSLSYKELNVGEQGDGKTIKCMLLKCAC